MGLDAGKSYETSIALRHPHLVGTDAALLARQAKGKDEMSDLLSQRETPYIREGGGARSRESDQRGERGVSLISSPSTTMDVHSSRIIHYVDDLTMPSPNQPTTHPAHERAIAGSVRGANGLLSNSAEGFSILHGCCGCNTKPCEAEKEWMNPDDSPVFARASVMAEPYVSSAQIPPQGVGCSALH
ncbi:hypothetical protein CH63R_04667 [Colletotrichum higginsianum IMI 349063]|uniref:Uncharacterized protein n=1 Tax=Colletotrichum higginsianum (strain IMI 349063) TaxID=759273 RepID=A0A1B7YJY2_COLHI|nr:hypothetical protein CH63R_04667 [Colletotrichum higginsianum IMI 349063]OBR12371.1 hypothetical protein CH63R_04667 [Colletotrichum higginsianum IMI 349063]